MRRVIVIHAVTLLLFATLVVALAWWRWDSSAFLWTVIIGVLGIILNLIYFFHRNKKSHKLICKHIWKVYEHTVSTDDMNFTDEGILYTNSKGNSGKVEYSNLVKVYENKNVFAMSWTHLQGILSATKKESIIMIVVDKQNLRTRADELRNADFRENFAQFKKDSAGNTERIAKESDDEVGTMNRKDVVSNSPARVLGSQDDFRKFIKSKVGHREVAQKS